VTLEAIPLDAGVRRATVDFFQILEGHERPRRQDALSVLGEDDVVRDLDAGVQTFAVIQEAQDVAELERRIDGHVTREEMFGSLGTVEEEVLGLLFEEIKRRPMTIRQAPLQSHRSGGKSIDATAGQGRQELGDVDHLRRTTARDRDEEGRTLGVQGAGAPIVDELRPALLERELEFDQQTADAGDRAKDGGHLVRVLRQSQEGLDVAEDQGRTAAPEQLAQQLLAHHHVIRASHAPHHA